jgi:pimeloyl-ACP methyl ester carboxylesterase
VKQTHYLPVTLEVGEKSVARLAIEPVGRAIVFVHGFGGETTGTWDEFSRLLPAQVSCSGHDVFFYGYESKGQPAVQSAAELREWLRDLLAQPIGAFTNSLLPVAPPRSVAFAYERVIIAAHSLGAVVARLALLDLSREEALLEPLGRVRLALFAPAHMGADIIPLAAAVLGFIRLAVAAPLLKFFWPSLKDLEPGSQTLKQLTGQTLDALAVSRERGTSIYHLVAEVVIHGQKDRIVSQNQFCSDPPLTRFPGRDHFDVCKPNAGYMNPLTELMRRV